MKDILTDGEHIVNVSRQIFVGPQKAQKLALVRPVCLQTFFHHVMQVSQSRRPKFKPSALIIELFHITGKVVKNRLLIFCLFLTLALLDQKGQAAHISTLMIYIFIDHHFACRIDKSLFSLLQFLEPRHAGQIIDIIQGKLVHIIHEFAAHTLIACVCDIFKIPVHKCSRFRKHTPAAVQDLLISHISAYYPAELFVPGIKGIKYLCQRIEQSPLRYPCIQKDCVVPPTVKAPVRITCQEKDAACQMPDTM